MTVLVTGATGFIGSAVARSLIKRGESVRTLARRGGDRRNIDGLGLEVIEGDLLDPAARMAAVRGISALYHVAADYRLWVPNPATMFATNVDATVDLLRRAADAGAKRMVYTSSVAVLGHTVSGAPADEETMVTLADMVGAYKRSKFLAEESVRGLAQAGLPIVIVNPTAPVGPRDIRPTPTGRMILEAAAGRMPAYVDTGLNLVHVDDIAHGHLLAHDRGKIGARYIMGGENLTLSEILARIAALTGRRAPWIKLPTGAIMPVAYISELWARVSGREPFTTVDGVKLARKKMFFTSLKAERALGYSARPIEEALIDAIAWFRAAKRL